jgi:protein gp37
MHPAWARRLRDDCSFVGTAFFFKQWGAWSPALVQAAGSIHVPCQHYGPQVMVPWREEDVGRLLDGALWEEQP